MTRNISLSKPDQATLRMVEHIEVKHAMVYLDNSDFNAGGTFGKVNRARIITEIDEEANKGTTMVQPIESDGRVMAFSMPYMRGPIESDGKKYTNNRTFCWSSYQDATMGHEKIFRFLDRVYNGEKPPDGAVDFETEKPLKIPRILVLTVVEPFSSVKAYNQIIGF